MFQHVPKLSKNELLACFLPGLIKVDTRPCEQVEIWAFFIFTLLPFPSYLSFPFRYTWCVQHDELTNVASLLQNEYFVKKQY